MLCKVWKFIQCRNIHILTYNNARCFLSNVPVLQDDVHCRISITNLKYLPATLFHLCLEFSSFGPIDKPSNAQKTNVITQKTSGKKSSSPRITLIGTDEKLTIPTLEEAEKIAKRRDLKLIKIQDFDTKTERPIYRLMTGKQYYEEERKSKQQKQRSTQKAEKLLTLSTKISEHDLLSKIKNCQKWLLKDLEVRVTISGHAGNIESSEKMFQTISTLIGDTGRIVQKREKNAEIKFQIIPPKKEDKHDKGVKENNNNVELKES